MRPPRICLISAFPKLVFLSARLSLIFLLYEMSSLVGVIKLSWGRGEDVQAVSRQCLQAALRMGAGSAPCQPQSLSCWDDAAGGNSTRGEGTEQSSLQEYTCTSKH